MPKKSMPSRSARIASSITLRITWACGISLPSGPTVTSPDVSSPNSKLCITGVSIHSLIKINIRSHRHDAAWVQPWVTAVIVPLDVGEVDRRPDIGVLVKSARVVPQRWVVGQRMAVAFEMAVINDIETHECREQADIRLGQFDANEIELVCEAGLKPIERVEDA